MSLARVAYNSYWRTFQKFTDLPPELRQTIYELYVREYGKNRYEAARIIDNPPLPPLARTCRLLRTEVLPVFYHECTFRIKMCCSNETPRVRLDPASLTFFSTLAEEAPYRTPTLFQPLSEGTDWSPVLSRSQSFFRPERRSSDLQTRVDALDLQVRLDGRNGVRDKGGAEEVFDRIAGRPRKFTLDDIHAFRKAIEDTDDLAAHMQCKALKQLST
ncbi:hypothetical protein LTR37_010508 [Vermiconidia calcicola]|uniref:Uncharacterized protein n=1 Tax=Vermiconidia calcicola TaxID=1690605 RepID=A0ACC3N4R1_9PEZI|nr:hypothetical protein LTR37_010508 [Vermiconidia calcicola]